MKIVMPYMEETELMKKALDSLKNFSPNLEVVTLQDKGEGWVNLINSQLGTDDIIIWHTDVIAVEGWFEKLEQYIKEFPNSIIGTKLCYTDDTIQSAGGFIGRNLIAGNVGSHELDFGQHEYVREFPFVTFAGVFIPKNIGEEIKMDINYSPIYFDDVDYCLTAKEKGYKVLYVPVKLYHYESQTTRHNPEFRIKQAKNWDYFKAKWLQKMEDFLK